ncbi:conserved unknown protein [Ectocarpus siliculosus]|uniref:FHF complex subunit HOOK-interacting protein C-terminal domain-containing protein n=1 Tax=Ectocarpus siliculosus TaxID=2880 RepID=D8LN16_ECTSI|nr:conserved unknown protein [Ectocarpus siliculosus]|eukprot:CBN76257.1 conserved unknown protein [Ectocarpus siliculosus]
MSSRKRMSIGSFNLAKSSPTEAVKSNKATKRRSSISSWAVGISGALNRSLQSAAATADRFERRLFAEYDEQMDEDGSDAYGMLCAQRGQGQRAEFENRYKHLVETLGDLSLAADIDPEAAATLLDDSRATEDLDNMLALLRAEERQNSRAEQSRGSGGGPSDGKGGSAEGSGGGDLLATPCLEFLLEERVVKLLCELGAADRPAGTLALVLGAIASLLGQRLEGAGGSSRAGKGRPQLGSGQRRMLSSSISRSRASSSGVAQGRARARVQANLARLLGAIWRKLREESALLDFFLRADDTPDPRSDGTTATGGGGALRLDVFDKLLPLLELPGRAGQQAREACLVALSVKDPRVGRYIAGSTQLCAQLAQTLTSRYLALYDTLEELQVAAELPTGKEEGGAGGVAGILTQQQPERAEATFTEALSLFLQHLRFCNAVGLVAADTRACLRPTLGSNASNNCGGGSAVGSAAPQEGSDVITARGETDANRASAEPDDGVAASLASQVRHLLLSNAIGPALTSALETRARWTTTIAARTMAELSAGAEGYGVAVAGLAASVQEGGGGRRPLGPLVDTVSTFLLRVSTLELLGSLAELRDDCVLLDLVLCPGSEPLTPAATTGDRRYPRSEKGGGGQRWSVEALLDDGQGALEGLRVSRAMVDSFGSAFGGSPIHPNFRLFSASSHLSLEGYLVAAQQRQIHQLMEGARGGCSSGEGERGGGGAAADVDTDMLDMVVGSDGGKVLEAVAAVAAAEEGEEGGAASRGCSRGASEGGEFGEFDAAAFVREHGDTLASAADADGSFLRALFDCLEAVFERSLEENLEVTGVLSSLCLAATAAEVSPVRRLLLLLLFDGTQDAPFRSMRRILEKLWASAQERVASLPNAPRLLAQARASLGMPAIGDSEETADVAGVTGTARGGRQGSRGMREELSNSKRRQQGEAGGGGEAENEEDIDELPTSLDELLKEAAFPTFVSPPVLC